MKRVKYILVLFLISFVIEAVLIRFGTFFHNIGYGKDITMFLIVLCIIAVVLHFINQTNRLF